MTCDECGRLYSYREAGHAYQEPTMRVLEFCSRVCMLDYGRRNRIPLIIEMED